MGAFCKQGKPNDSKLLFSFAQ
jgi:hypothetical protein